jgi:hypothetical protein
MPAVRHRVEMTGQIVAQHELTTIVTVTVTTTIPTIVIIIGTTIIIAMIVIKAATIIPITDTIADKAVRDETPLSLTTIGRAMFIIATMMFITIAETTHTSHTAEDVGS